MKLWNCRNWGNFGCSLEINRLGYSYVIRNETRQVLNWLMDGNGQILDEALKRDSDH